MNKMFAFRSNIANGVKTGMRNLLRQNFRRKRRKLNVPQRPVSQLVVFFEYACEMMKRLIVAFVLFNMRWIVSEAAPPSPVAVHVDCDTKKTAAPFAGSLCDCLKKALPRAIKNGRILMGGENTDMDPSASTLQATLQAVLPCDPTPKLTLPKLRASKIRTAKVPKLKAAADYGDNYEQEEESSAERLEKLQKGTSRLLRAVNMFDKMDKYISDRTRIIVKKIAQFYD